jgi:hypothetical protein
VRDVRTHQALPMKREKAVSIAKEVAAARLKWGKQASPPYTMHQIMDAVLVLEAEGLLEQPIGPTPEEVTKLRRQLAACQNREKARKQPQADFADNFDPQEDQG